MNLFRCMLLCFTAVALATSAARGESPVYKDPSAPVEARVQDLLRRMTLEEKIGQMTQLNFSTYTSDGTENKVDVAPEKLARLIREYHVGSLLNGRAVPPKQWYEVLRTVQEIAIRESRLGVPIIYGIDHVHGTNYILGGTVFPHNLNIACTFNDAFAALEGLVTTLEAEDLGQSWNFSPVLDVGINPSWSRLYETFGEEPLVAARMGSLYIKALQADGHMAATAKHFLGYSDPRSGWDRTPAQIPDQYLYEIFVPPFRAAVQAGVKTVMINSAEINGVPVHSSKRILTGLLRDELGFRGVAVTDWEDILKLVNHHHVAADEKEATRIAVEAGIDMAMTPFTTDFCRYLRELVAEGAIPESRIDVSAARVLRLKLELGLFENPYPRNDRFDRIGHLTHQLAAFEAAAESIVLLKNERGLLPLSREKRILLVGPSADSRRNLCGGWTLGWLGAPEKSYRMDSLYSYLTRVFPQVTLLTDLRDLKPEAANADVIVMALGEEPHAEGPGNVGDLLLPASQVALLDAVAKTGKPSVLVMIAGRPRIIAPYVSKVRAVVWAGLPGFMGGQALAKVLNGAINPSGRLAFSYPSTNGHMIPYHHKASDKSTALYPFGHGLSYTRFGYRDLTLSDTVMHRGGALDFTVRVSNDGRREGREAVLWLLTDEVGRITRPVARLASYEKITLEPGAAKTVSLHVKADDLAYPDEHGRPILEDGWYTLRVGNLSTRFQLKQ